MRKERTSVGWSSSGELGVRFARVVRSARLVRSEETVDPIETEDEEDEGLREEKDGVTYAGMEDDAPDSA